MRIKLTSLFVEDQGKALNFYTGTLGAVKKADIVAGKYRWLTVASPEEQDGTWLILCRYSTQAGVPVPWLMLCRHSAQARVPVSPGKV
jgi:hypothetical protein